MEAKIIKTEEEYKKALKWLEEIFNAPENTAEGDEPELLTVLIENYEDEKFPIEAPEPLEAVKFRMDQLGMDNNDLAKVIGYKSRVSELFSRKRKLTLNMIRRLHKKINIPYVSLSNDY